MTIKHLKYSPELNQITGSVNATIVMLQLEYWFSKTASNKFYKFLDICEHERYKSGDSWTEELSFTKNEFRTAFAKIGKVYKSKKAFRESQDLFGGKYYASYYDRMKGLTYYIRNNAKLSALFNTESTDSKKQTSVNSKSASPISVDYSKSLTTENNTHTPTEPVPFETIQALFNQCCPSFPQLSFLTSQRKAKLQKLWHNLGQTLETFKQAFFLAEASDFLTGRLGSWRASFDWLISEDRFIALLEGGYTNPHYKKNVAHETALAAKTHCKASQKFTVMYSHNWGYEELEKLEEQYIDSLLSAKQA